MAHPAVCMACYLYHLKIAYLEDRLSRPEVDAVIYSIMQCERFNYDKVTKSRETAPERSQKEVATTDPDAVLQTFNEHVP